MKINQLRHITLASGSPRRKEYLNRYGLEFDVITGGIDESSTEGERPLDFALRMAKEKSRVVRKQCSPESVVISADTIVIVNGRIVGKPSDHASVLPMLKQLNGFKHQVITAYCIYDIPNEKEQTRAVETDVQFNHVPEDMLKAYAYSMEPLDKAGAYSIQGLGTILVESINGSYNNVVGLPIEILMLDLLEMEVISF